MKFERISEELEKFFQFLSNFFKKENL